MRRTGTAVLAMFFVVVASVHTLAQSDTLVVIHVNDTHSHLVPYGPKTPDGVAKRGGIARVATIVRQLQATARHTLELHGGDLMVGDFMYTRFRGVPEINILESLGWDAWTLGNHEFDAGPDFLENSLVEAGVPNDSFAVISANLDLSGHPGLARLVRPYTIRDYGTFKVGIFGLTPTMANSYSHPQPVVITDPIAAAQAMVDSLRGRCDLILCLSHLGHTADVEQLAASVGGIDVIVGGHSHTVVPEAVPVVNPDGDTTWVVQAGSHYDYVGTFQIIFTGSSFALRNYRLIPVDETVPDDPEVGVIVRALVDTLMADPRYGDVYNEVIGQALVDMDRQVGSGREKDTPVGNLIVDALLQAAGTDVAIDVHGWISDKLWAGPITRADVYHIAYYGYDPQTGYGFNVVRVGLTGNQIRLGMEYTLRKAPEDGDLWPEVAGMKVVYDSRSLLLLVKEITIGDRPMAPDSLYTVAMTDGLAEFLGNAGLTPAFLEPVGISEYEALVRFVQENSPIEYHTEGRIVDLGATGVRQGEAPVPTTPVLMVNQPNPFRHVTVLRVEPANTAAETARLLIFDVNGRQVRTLFEGRLTGPREFRWDGSSDEHQPLPSGTYLAVLQTGANRTVRKMLLIR